ncbi:DUF4232 domain-containing protein [Kocuria sp. ICS0012]|uniref:DUF4232 domain-containing protein n=1 Tax=Kocuria sp. ICS0012 TaxID=1834155 RepID=UPI0007E9D324|nr:DUF4232 domain-containing protein [Kocuria sp. ICS0012]OBA51230.1 hypothetical protein A5728_00930 [Kocuria sp. ICS0012]
MRSHLPAPRGTHTATRPLLAATALSALMVLSACGSSDGASSEEQNTAPAGASVSASATASPSDSSMSPSPSASRSASPSASRSASPSASAEATEATNAAASGGQEGQAAESAQPSAEPDRLASAPELGMPTASPFDQAKADAQRAGGTCSAGQLSGSLTPQQGAAGSVIASLTLTNNGSAPCTLSGYPGVSFVDANGAPVGAPASRDASGAGTVTLQPGASASAGVRITQPGVIGQVCNPHQAAGVRVYPPDSYESLVVPYSGQACGNPKVSQLQVKGFGS